MEDKKISERDSLLLITQMIDTAKREQGDDGKGWIIWGWLLFVASIATWLNQQYGWFSTWFFWNAFGIASVALLVYSVIRYFFFKKTERVRTYTADLFQKLNIGFFIFLVFIIVAMNNGLSPMKGFPLLLALYGFWALIYGTALHFRPSVIGAFATWAIAFTCLFIDDFRLIMLLHGLAVVLGYIIPGHIANFQFNKQGKQNKGSV